METQKQKKLIQSKLVNKLMDTIYFLERESEIQNTPEDVERYQKHIRSLEKLVEEVRKEAEEGSLFQS